MATTPPTCTVSELWIYPVKSMGGTKLSSCDLSDRGLVDDRRWMVVDADGMFITQRTHPRMTLISVDARADALVFAAPGMPPLTLARDDVTGPARVVRVFESACDARVMGGGASAWLEAFLRVPCDLVYMPDATRRSVGKYAEADDIVSFADGFPILLANEASLDELNARLDTPVAMRRFRPNIVISGAGAWDEDAWKRISVGTTPMRVAKPCGRCVMVNVDPQTGETSKQPLRTLATYRRQGKRIVFGQNLIHDARGTLHVGDAVTITQTGDAG